MERINIAVSAGFSLAETVAPVAWGGGRWPNQDWLDNRLVTVAAGPAGPVVRIVSQPDSSHVELLTNYPDLDHQRWADDVLGVRRTPPNVVDPVIAAIANRFPGMRPLSNGSLFDGIVTAIVGQSISVQAAAVTERKLAELFNEPIELGSRLYWPAPNAEQLANSDPAIVRRSGVTQRRADAIVEIARRAVENRLLPHGIVQGDEAAVYAAVLALPLVGRWTAESVLLWGLGSDDAYPAGDVALLRAARLAYDLPGMTHSEMDILAESWRPGRSWASRWLWINLFGPARVSG